MGMTHPYIEKCSPLSLLETPTVDVKACIRGLVSPSGKLFAYASGAWLVPLASSSPVVGCNAGSTCIIVKKCFSF